MYTHPGESQKSDDAILAHMVSEADFQSIMKARQDAADWFFSLPAKLFRSIFKRKTAK
jgi:hypothetical protein